MAELVLIDATLVDDHPDNPRIVFRDDVIDGIAANLEGEYPQKHAMSVRSVGDRYQIMSGHHRIRAARKAGLDAVWAFVEELDDDAARMELGTNNSQGELSPLELGIHSLKVVTSDGGRGRKGGLSEYARRMGKTRQNINTYRDGAEVFLTAKGEHQCACFIDKAMHLAAIHKADEEFWPIIVPFMLDKKWSAADTAHWVGIVREFKVPAKWDKWLPLPEVIKKFLATKEFSPQTVERLIATANAGIATIRATDIERKDANAYVLRFRDWLHGNTGGDSWDVRKIERQINAILAEIMSLDDGWHHGKWQDHLDKLEDGSVSLVLTDPPYGVGFQSDYRLDRRGKRKHKTIEGDEGLDALTEFLGAVSPKLKDDAHIICFCHPTNEPDVRNIIKGCGYTIRSYPIWVKNNTGMGDPNTTFAPKHERMIHAVKGSPILFNRLPDVLEADRIASDRHPTEKPVDLLRRLIDGLTANGELVADPFGGVASTAVAAKEAGRRYWSCEVEEGYFKEGKARLHGAV